MKDVISEEIKLFIQELQHFFITGRPTKNVERNWFYQAR